MSYLQETNEATGNYDNNSQASEVINAEQIILINGEFDKYIAYF